jgi:hypothetical protein
MRALYRCAVAVMLLIPIGVFASAPAGAAGGTICKTESGTAALSPGLTPTNKAQTISASITIGGCTGGGVTGGSVKMVLKEKATNCKGLTKTGVKETLTGSITWSSAAASTFTGSATTGPKVGQATITATVSGGLFKGSHITNTIMFSEASGGGGCTAKSPLKKLSVNETKVFVVK